MSESQAIEYKESLKARSKKFCVKMVLLKKSISC